MATPTWYSIRNRLEAGEVNARNSFERFLAVLCSSYSCLDVWYRKAQDTEGVWFRRSTAEIKIMFMQEDKDYIATESWERNGERARLWQLFRGTEKEIRKSVIGVLPSLTALTDTKRHGEYNFGKKQPYKGQGGLTYTTDGGVTILSGRFGDILLDTPGVDFKWEDLTWSFKGCVAEVTYPYEVDVICQKFFGQIAYNCDSVDPGPGPVGCCFLPRPSCEELFQMTEQELADLNQLGWTRPKCDKFGGSWQGRNSICPVFDEQDVFNLCGFPKPRGCCIVGDCLNYQVIADTSLGECGKNAGSDSYLHITDPLFDCGDPAAIEAALGCGGGTDPWDNPNYPSSITLTVNWSQVDQIAGYNWGTNTWNLGGNSNTVDYTYGKNAGLLTAPGDFDNNYCPAGDASCGQGGIPQDCSSGYNPEESDVEHTSGAIGTCAFNITYTLFPVTNEAEGTYATQSGSVQVPAQTRSISATNSRYFEECEASGRPQRTKITKYWSVQTNVIPFSGNVRATFALGTGQQGSVTAALRDSSNNVVTNLVSNVAISSGGSATRYPVGGALGMGPYVWTDYEDSYPTQEEFEDRGVLFENNNILTFFGDTTLEPNGSDNALNITRSFPRSPTSLCCFEDPNANLDNCCGDAVVWVGFEGGLTVTGTW